MIEKISTTIINYFLNSLKLYVLKILHPQNFRFHIINNISFFSSIIIRKKGKLSINKNVRINKNSTIGSINGGYLIINENAFFNNNCYIVSHEMIEIGKNVMIGPNTVIVDHDHLITKTGICRKKYKTNKIKIDDNTWIGANCTILKGTTIGKNCIIGAGSIVKGNIPNNTIFINKGEKIIKRVGE